MSRAGRSGGEGSLGVVGGLSVRIWGERGLEVGVWG